jgi:hypothetical protein
LSADRLHELRPALNIATAHGEWHKTAGQPTLVSTDDDACRAGHCHRGYFLAFPDYDRVMLNFNHDSVTEEKTAAPAERCPRRRYDDGGLANANRQHVSWIYAIPKRANRQQAS